MKNKISYSILAILILGGLFSWITVESQVVSTPTSVQITPLPVPTTIRDKTNANNNVVVDSSGALKVAIGGSPIFKVWDDISSVTIGSITTDSAGTNYVTFTTGACYELSLINNSGVSISVRRNGSGTALPIPSGNGYTFKGISNANQLSLIRTDFATNQVTLYYEVYSR